MKYYWILWYECSSWVSSEKSLWVNTLLFSKDYDTVLPMSLLSENLFSKEDSSITFPESVKLQLYFSSVEGFSFFSDIVCIILLVSIRKYTQIPKNFVGQRRANLTRLCGHRTDNALCQITWSPRIHLYNYTFIIIRLYIIKQLKIHRNIINLQNLI